MCLKESLKGLAVLGKVAPGLPRALMDDVLDGHSAGEYCFKIQSLNALQKAVQELDMIFEYLHTEFNGDVYFKIEWK